MPSDAVTFAVDPACPPELALAADGLAAGLTELGRACEVLSDPWPEALAGRAIIVEVGATERRADRWRLGIGPRADLELIDRSGRSSAIPFPLPPLPRSRVGTPRVLLVGGDAGRRTRLMLRLFDALGDRPRCDVVVWRSPSDEILRQRFVAEVHPEIGAAELARLLGSVAVLVEVSDQPTPEAMLLAAIGRAGGIPTVMHEEPPFDRWEGTVVVREWSGEALADAVLAAAVLPRNESVPAAIRKTAAERLAGALFP